MIALGDMIADILSNKKLQAIFKELFIKCRNWIYLSYLSHRLFFSVPEEVRLNSTYYLIIKTHNKRELQNTAANHSADIDYKDFMKIYKKCTNEPYSFLTRDTKLPASNYLKFRKNLLLPYKNNINWQT